MSDDTDPNVLLNNLRNYAQIFTDNITFVIDDVKLSQCIDESMNDVTEIINILHGNVKIDKNLKFFMKRYSNINRLTHHIALEILSYLENLYVLFYLQVFLNMDVLTAFNEKYNNMIVFVYNHRYYVVSTSSIRETRLNHLKAFYGKYKNTMRKDTRLILLDPFVDVADPVIENTIYQVSGYEGIRNVLSDESVYETGMVTLSSVGQLIDDYKTGTINFNDCGNIVYDGLSFNTILIMPECYDLYMKHLQTQGNEECMLTLKELINNRTLIVCDTSIDDLCKNDKYNEYHTSTYGKNIKIHDIPDTKKTRNDVMYAIAKYYKYTVIDITDKTRIHHREHYDIFINSINISIDH
jgi:hypothetical protein